MGEKDITEKVLADYNDVFADIMNVFMFQGRQVVSPDNLETTKDISQYKSDGKIHEQERDVPKFLKKEKLTVTMVGLEHETKPEKFMPVRQIGYDGQSYRAQLLDKKANRIYPVITLVLYFGMEEWPYSRHLVELADIPDEYKPFVSDYEMKNLFQVAFLTPEQVKLFRSDFRYVADYFVQMRTTNDYKPSADIIKHVDATMKLMAVLTNDKRFADVIPALPAEGGTSMKSVLEKVETKGKVEGKKEGKKEGKEEGIVEGKISVYYQDMGMTPDQIAKKMNQPIEVVVKVISEL